MSLKTILANVATALGHLTHTDATGKVTVAPDDVGVLKTAAANIEAAVENFDSMIEKDVEAALERLGFIKPPQAGTVPNGKTSTTAGKVG